MLKLKEQTKDKTHALTFNTSWTSVRKPIKYFVSNCLSFEVWKALHDSNHPLNIEKVVHDDSTCTTRSVTNGDLKEFGKSNIVHSTFLSDASRVWNKCPNNIKECDTIWKAKKAIKSFVVTLPI